MIDRESIDQAGLEAVGLLDPQEVAAFTHEHRVNPELQRAAAEMRDLVACLAAAGTPATALPPQALSRIQARIASTGTNAPISRISRRAGERFRTRKLPAWLPWAVAAGFALLATWQGYQSSSFALRNAGNEPRPRIPGKGWANGGTPGAGDATEASPSGSPGSEHSVGPGGRPRVPPKFFTNRESTDAARLQDDPAKLRDEITRLRDAEYARQHPPAGAFNLQMIEMLPPGVKRPTDVKETLSARVGEAIAAGLQPPTTQPAAPPASEESVDSIEVRLDGSPGKPDMHILGGPVPDLTGEDMSNGREVRHSAFPPPEAYERLGYTALSDGTVYDGRGGLWYLSENGIDRLGRKIPDDWQPPDPGESDPGPAPPRDQDRADASPDAAAPDSIVSSETTGLPWAYSSLDHEGRGTLVVQNIPPVPEGQFYQLWMFDQRSEEPIKVRALPPLESGTARIGFELTTPGFIPSGYLMTLENAGSVRTPSNRVILQGP